MAVSVTYRDNFDKYMKSLTSSLMSSAVDIENDLVNSARSSAPHKSGDLEKGITGKISDSGSAIKITVAAVARGSNGYDYADKMHNGAYFLGEQSKAKGSGYSGIAGNRFPVGKRYLQMPAVMNHKAYVAYFDKAMTAVKE